MKKTKKKKKTLSGVVAYYIIIYTTVAVKPRRGSTLKFQRKEKKWSVTFGKGPLRKGNRRRSRCRLGGYFRVFKVVTHIMLYKRAYGFVLFCFLFVIFINLLTGRVPKQVSNAVSRSSRTLPRHCCPDAEGRPLLRRRGGSGR